MQAERYHIIKSLKMFESIKQTIYGIIIQFYMICTSILNPVVTCKTSMPHDVCSKPVLGPAHQCVIYVAKPGCPSRPWKPPHTLDGLNYFRKNKFYSDGLMQKRRNSSALALELCLFYIKLLFCYFSWYWIMVQWHLFWVLPCTKFWNCQGKCVFTFGDIQGCHTISVCVCQYPQQIALKTLLFQ